MVSSFPGGFRLYVWGWGWCLGRSGPRGDGSFVPANRRVPLCSLHISPD